MSGGAVTWLGHSTVVVELDGIRLLTDPVLRDRVGPLPRIAPAIEPEATADVDAVLLSHLHADHADLDSLRRLNGSAPFLVPRGAGRWLRARGLRDVHELAPGDEGAVGTVRVTATPAVHDGRRWALGPVAAPIGFLLHGSCTCYFAGDTDLFGAMRELGGELRAALLPVWGWGRTVREGHLDPSRAADAAALLEPDVAVPIHWGTFALPRPLRRLEAPERPAREFAALAARRAPGVEVRVLAPGGHTEL